MNRSSPSLALAVGLVGITGVFVARYLGHAYRRFRNRTRILSLLQREDVQIQNPGRLEEKLQALSDNWQGQAHDLQVVSDFDMTLTHFKDSNGEICATCHGVLEKSEIMPAWFRSETKKLKEYYFPLEYSPNLSKQDKAKLMKEWWTKVHNLLIQAKMPASSLPDMVRESRLLFREGAGDLLGMLSSHNIPLCIVSAGVGDILEEAVHSRLGTFNNITVVSNRMIFNKEGIVEALSDPVIHSYNKAEAVERHCESFSTRRNIVLIGDSLGDTDMVPKHKEDDAYHVLRIGFLNDKSRQAENLQPYLKAYDIVLLGDGDMSVVNSILSLLLGKGI